jgi:methylated-DNA-protein-cysteine methyltransferase related protein
MQEKSQAILAVLNAIPPGHVISYGEVARRAGLASGARLVCRVLRDLPDRANTPWWRVIRADGRFGMPAESSGGHTQRSKLKAEGLVFNGDRIQGPWW